jgi:hypothetical protein
MLNLDFHLSDHRFERQLTPPSLFQSLTALGANRIYFSSFFLQALFQTTTSPFSAFL